MACEKCNFKGFIEDVIQTSNGTHPFVRQCKNCLDDEAYTVRIKLGISLRELPENVIPITKGNRK